MIRPSGVYRRVVVARNGNLQLIKELLDYVGRSPPVDTRRSVEAFSSPLSAQEQKEADAQLRALTDYVNQANKHVPNCVSLRMLFY